MEEIGVAILSESQTLMENLLQELRNKKYFVTLARNTKEGISRIWYEQPHVILLDWNSIHKDGLKLFKSFKEHPRTRHSFIIVLSSEDVIEKYDFNVELDDFVLTPIRWKEIDGRIRKAQGKFARPDIEESIQIDDMEINEATYEVTIKGKQIHLTQSTFGNVR